MCIRDRYPSVRIPLFARNVVSTSHPLAAQAGLRTVSYTHLDVYKSQLPT